MGVEVVVCLLEFFGVIDVFGFFGGVIFLVYDLFMDVFELCYILVWYEQGVGYVVEGYVFVFGKVGVCIVMFGFGVINFVMVIVDVYMDLVLLLVIIGQVFFILMGMDVFQEVDIVGIMMLIIKYFFFVKDVVDIFGVIVVVYEIVGIGCFGFVFVDIMKDVQQVIVLFVWLLKIDLFGYCLVMKVYGKQIQVVVVLFVEVKKLVLYVGGGVICGCVVVEFFELVELIGVFVVMIFMVCGVFFDLYLQYFGMLGMYGMVFVVFVLQEVDFLVFFGVCFDDWVIGKVVFFVLNVKVVYVDIDLVEIFKIWMVDVLIVGDVCDVFIDFDVVFCGVIVGGKFDIDEWWLYFDGLCIEFLFGYVLIIDGLLVLQYVIQCIGEFIGFEGIFVLGVGQYQMWVVQFIKYECLNVWLNLGGVGIMGYLVFVVMGVKVVELDCLVWVIDGDGCFQMINQEFVICMINNILIKVVIINNFLLGMVCQWQMLFYDGCYLNIDLNMGYGMICILDFVKLVEVYGCFVICVEKEEEVDVVIKFVFEMNDCFVVIDFVVSVDFMVWLMVLQGVSNSYVQYVCDYVFVFDEED